MRRYRIGTRGLIALFAAVALSMAAAAVIAAVGDPDSAPAPEATATAAARPLGETSLGEPERRSRAGGTSPRPKHRPALRRRRRVDDAGEFADRRDGRVAFAIAGPDGTVHGRNEHELFQSASLVKPMILAAELQRVADAGGELDPEAEAELRRMITVSDNDAATSVFARVGADGLEAIAHRAGMRDFEASETWGASAISAADMAAMFDNLGRVLPERYEKFGLGLLGSIVPGQSWGIPAVASEGDWSVRFKGGWRPDPDGQIVNQAAELRRRGSVRAIAVLTDQGPSMEYGVETVEGVAERLLGGG